MQRVFKGEARETSNLKSTALFVVRVDPSSPIPQKVLSITGSQAIIMPNLLVEKPAIEGGRPVRSGDNPLPKVFPREIGPNAMKYFRELVESGNTANFLERFDKAFASLIGSKYALSLSNCTVACHTALAAAGVGPGDEVVVSPITDYGTVYGIIAQRAIPVFADVDRLNGNVTAETIERVITDRTKAIMVVHWAGIVCDMDPIIEVADKHGLVVIEDCCQSILAEYKGKKSGTIGDIGCFSFDVEKHMSCGSGGAIVTDREEYLERARNFAYARGSIVEDPAFGRRHKVLGNNYRFDVVRAALALAQLEILPRKVRRYSELGAQLNEGLEEIDGVIPCRVPEGSDAAYWIYPFLVEVEKFRVSLDEFGKAVSAEGLPASPGRYYLVPESHDLLNDLRYTYGEGVAPGGRADKYLNKRYSAEMTPNAKWYVEHMLRWPFTDKYSGRDIEDILAIVRKVADYYRVR